MRLLPWSLLIVIGCAGGSRGAFSAASDEAMSVRHVREQLTALYAENSDAFRRFDLAGVMRLRAPDFHTISPDGRIRDRGEMEQYIQGIMNGVRRWNVIEFAIDSLHLVGDTAVVIVSQHLDRMALRPDNQVHRVETWVTQRETWIRSGTRWLLWRVDELRNQRRLIDGTPG